MTHFDVNRSFNHDWYALPDAASNEYNARTTISLYWRRLPVLNGVWRVPPHREARESGSPGWPCRLLEPQTLRRILNEEGKKRSCFIMFYHGHGGWQRMLDAWLLCGVPSMHAFACLC